MPSMPFRSLSIKMKFALLVVGAALVAGIAVGTLSYRIGKEGLVEASAARLDREVLIRSDVLEAYLTRARQGLAEIAQNNALGEAMDGIQLILNAEGEKIASFFKDEARAVEEQVAYDGTGSKLLYAMKYGRFHGSLQGVWTNARIADIYAITEDGLVAFSATKGPELLKNVSEMENGVLADLVARSQAAGIDAVVETGLTAYAAKDGDHSAFMAQALAFTNWGQVQRRGTVVVRIAASGLDAVIAPSVAGEGIEEAMLLSPTGQIEAGSRSGASAGAMPALLLEAAATGGTGHDFASAGDENLFYVWHPLDLFGERMLLAISESEENVLASANALAQSAFWTTLLVVLAMMGVGYYGAARLARPLSELSQLMNRLTAGDTSVEIAAARRGDEIGDMARALETFRRQAIEKGEIEAVTLQKDRQIAAEREQVGAERERNAGELERTVRVLAGGLHALAEGRLDRRIETVFPPTLEELRLDYNRSVDQLCQTIDAIRESAIVVRSGSLELEASSRELSSRTERQAATLEETAAALSETARMVQLSLKRCDEAVATATRTVGDAARSSEVVADAIRAMERIEGSSREIETIIGIIDQIAFQTNLLALNAGVEAARAGESGRGFAVVAQEVRELAQRSAKAAAEIGSLISRSSGEVEGGVALVRRTGEALTTIEGNAKAVSALVADVAEASREQARRLGEISGSMTELDQVTQQNAAMVHRTSSSARELAGEGDALSDRVGTFSLPGDEQGAPSNRRQAA